MVNESAGSSVPRPLADVGLDPQAELLERLRHATLGEYDIFGELGRGGMATVYLAHDVALDRKVAIKVMSPALLYGTGMAERFKREARTAAALSHPNIIPVYAVREVKGLLFFVMKLVQGTPLDAVIKELGPLPIPMIEALLHQVISAFGYAHRQGVIHRDIKPANIMIDDEGWAVVTDFGIAKVLDADGLTLTGMAVGTPTYMSPEQCSGEPVTGASDQYSLGVVAYEMLAGRPPFEGPTVMSLMMAHATVPPPPLMERRPDCPESLRVAVERMLAKNPAERWPSLEEVVAAIGARTLSHTDPTRTRLIELAKTGMARRVVARAHTPPSPVPRGRGPATPISAQVTAPGPAPAPAPASRPAWVLATGLLGGVALTAVFALVLFRNRGAPSDVTGAAPARESQAQVTVPSPDSVRPPGPEQRVTDAPTGRPPSATPSSPGRSQTKAGPAAAGAGPAGVTSGQRAGVRSDPTAPPPPPAPQPAPSSPHRTPVDSQLAPAAKPLVPIAPAPPDPAVRAAESVPAVVDERPAVEAAVRAYARALEAGRVDEAVRLFPGMPAEQRQGLEAFFRDGGSMRTQWNLSDVVVNGSVATLRIQGGNTVHTARTRPTTRRVNLRARLERGPAGWRLTALVN